MIQIKAKSRNFFEDEDYTAPEAPQKTIEDIASELEQIECLLTMLHAPCQDTRVNNIEISDDGNSFFAILITENDDATQGIVIYRAHSEERVMHNLIGAVRYFPPNDDNAFIDFNIYTDSIKRHYVKLPDISEEAKHSTRDEALEIIQREALKLKEKEEESKAYIELTGMDFVSAHTAGAMLNTLQGYKHAILNAMRNTS